MFISLEMFLLKKINFFLHSLSYMLIVVPLAILFHWLVINYFIPL